MPRASKTTECARRLRESQTDAERLLWSILRGKQLCGLKFRRQHPIGPFFADFVCESQRVVCELDGEYHDQIRESDLSRQRYLEDNQWRVFRFTNDAVLDDAEGVARAIAKQIGLAFDFRSRSAAGSGMMSRSPPGKGSNPK